MQFSDKILNDIDYILDHFDFERVHKVMTFLDWKWHDYDEISIGDLRQYARKLIKENLSQLIRYGHTKYTLECRGFVVESYNDDEDYGIRFSLRFSLSSWDNFE